MHDYIEKTMSSTAAGESKLIKAARLLQKTVVIGAHGTYLTTQFAAATARFAAPHLATVAKGGAGLTYSFGKAALPYVGSAASATIGGVKGAAVMAKGAAVQKYGELAEARQQRQKENAKSVASQARAAEADIADLESRPVNYSAALARKVKKQAGQVLALIKPGPVVDTSSDDNTEEEEVTALERRPRRKATVPSKSEAGVAKLPRYQRVVRILQLEEKLADTTQKLPPANDFLGNWMGHATALGIRQEINELKMYSETEGSSDDGGEGEAASRRKKKAAAACVGVHYATFTYLPATALAHVSATSRVGGSIMAIICNRRAVPTTDLAVKNLVHALNNGKAGAGLSGRSHEHYVMLGVNEFVLAYGIVAAELYSDGDGVVRKGTHMLWEQLTVNVKGPLPDAVATECVLEGYLTPTPLWDRIGQKALPLIAKYERALLKDDDDDDDVGNQLLSVRSTSVSDLVFNILVLDLLSIDSKQVDSIMSQLANVLHAVLVGHTIWGDAGESFRDRASTREAHHQQATDCRLLASSLSSLYSSAGRV
jgi:hypothetical protein